MIKFIFTLIAKSCKERKFMKIIEVSSCQDQIAVFFDNPVSILEAAGHILDLYKIVSADVTVNLPYLPGTKGFKHKGGLRLDIKKGRNKVLFWIFAALESSNLFLISTGTSGDKQELYLLEQEIQRVIQTQVEKVTE